jgi:protease II
MLTEDKLLQARNVIQDLQQRQDKIYSDLYDEISDRHKADHPDIDIMLEDFCYNNIYYSGKDINNFIKDLYSKEILLDNILEQ